ncbi:hypothetical protein MMC28_004967 [Mycoblastus sanguinarius]|nr:hypothetical protein [Mycoblastus sanguinarius]
MALPFFRLPSEIRSIVYGILFTSPHEEKLITPDPEGSRQRNGVNKRGVCMNGGLPLLRTCQQVHEEATAVLYGQNMFHFNDEPHGDELYNVVGFNILLPWCDFVTMHVFLSRIGRRNRSKIQHLRLSFFSKYFITYPDQLPSWSPKGGGGSCVADALELLCDDQNLQRVEILFPNEFRRGLTEFSDMFLKMSNQSIRTRLRRFRGVREVISLTIEEEEFGNHPGLLHEYDPDIYQWTRTNFLQVKAEMETERNEWEYRRNIFDTDFLWGTKYGFCSDPAIQIGPVVVATDDVNSNPSNQFEAAIVDADHHSGSKPSEHGETQVVDADDLSRVLAELSLVDA